MLSIDTIPTPGISLFGLGSPQPNLALLASEPPGTFGLGDRTSVESNGNACWGLSDGYSGRGYRPTLQLKLAKSPEQMKEARDRQLAVEGRDDEMSVEPCFRKQVADRYRAEHNQLVMAQARQYAARGGQVASS